MWDWADQGLMLQEDLKSLDIFSFGLIWAGVLGRRSVIKARDGFEPDALRLLEILRRVDQPTMDDLTTLGYTGWVQDFVREVLHDNREALLASRRLFGRRYEEYEKSCRDAVSARPQRLGAWVRAHATYLPASSEAPGVIESIARFSYRERPRVQEIIRFPYFEQLRQSTPEQILEIPEVECCFEDAAAELDRQFAGIGPKEDPRRRRHRKVREELRCVSDADRYA